jgi:tetratricopeptide (TPR) repeat protein
MPTTRGKFRLLCVSLSSLLLAAAEPEPKDCLAHHARQRYSEAASCYDSLRAGGAAVMPWAYLQGDVAAGMFRDPSQFWRQAIAADPAYLPATLRLAEWLLQAGRASEADPLIESLLRRAPDSPRVQYLAGKRRQSVEHLLRAVELQPRFGQAHYELAVLLRRAGHRDEADKHFQQFRLHAKTAVSIEDPILEGVQKLEQSASDLLLAGKRAEQANRLTEAAAAYQQAAAANPAMVQAHVNLIGVYSRLARAAEAEASFRAAVAIDANIPEAYYNYALLLVSTERRPEAEANFAKAIALNPNYADALNNLGTLLKARGETAAAEARFRAALTAQPQHPEANFNLARLLSEARRDGAERYFLAAVALDSERAAAYRYYFAQHYQKAGRMAEAIAQATAARALAELYGQKDLAAFLGDLVRQWQSGK